MCSEYDFYLIILWCDNNYVNHRIRLALTFLLSATQTFEFSVIIISCSCSVLVGVVSIMVAEAENHSSINKKVLQLCNYCLQEDLIQQLSS